METVNILQMLLILADPDWSLRRNDGEIRICLIRDVVESYDYLLSQIGNAFGFA